MCYIRYIFTFSFFALFTCCASDPLPSWNEGPAKQAIVEFIQKTTDKASPEFVPPGQRFATFDQDGTLFVEMPIPLQILYICDRLPIVISEKPELKNTEPFKTILGKRCVETSKLPLEDLIKLMTATLTGMTTDQFQTEAKEWLSTSRNKRWNCLHTELAYKPMLEVLRYFRSNGYKTYIVSGSGQDFIRIYSEQVYGIPREQIIGTLTEVNYSYDKEGKPILIKEPKYLLQNNHSGKPEGIHLMIGHKPNAAFGNSDGDKEMLEYAYSGQGKRLAMLVLHDDPVREYAYGPAQGLPDAASGRFTQALYDKAIKSGWIVISMKNDWNRIFSFD